MYPFFVGRETERFVSVACDIHYKVIATEIIAEGLPDEVEARIADVFVLAIRHRAVSLLVAHNHPAGDPTPSVYDYELTKVLLAALQRVTRGASAPFVLCDPLLRATPASARSLGNHENGLP